jgi:hypothetical protein
MEDAKRQTMTAHEAAELLSRHGSQRAAAKAAGCSHHTIARALGGQGAHRGGGDTGRAHVSTTTWQRSTAGRSTSGPSYMVEDDDDSADAARPPGLSWAPVVVGVVVLVAGWVAWRWWKRERERRQGEGPGG